MLTAVGLERGKKEIIPPLALGTPNMCPTGIQSYSYCFMMALIREVRGQNNYPYHSQDRWVGDGGSRVLMVRDEPMTGVAEEERFRAEPQ